MADYVLAIDQGTTSTRCIVFDRDLRLIEQSQLEHRQIYPKPGWVEHDPVEIWRATQHVVAHAIEAADAHGSIAAIGLTNQRETTVIWNRKTGEPYCNAIVWQDMRTDRLCGEIADRFGEDALRQRTGLPAATYFSGPKIRWALGNVDGLRNAAHDREAICGTMDTWLIWNLTGGTDGGAHVTDVTNASRTQLMDLATLQWDDELLRAMDVPRDMLPRIVPSSDRAMWGRTLPNGPVGDSVPVCGAVGDQQAALIGQCCFDIGSAKNTYGTGCFLLLNTGREAVRSNHGLLTTVAYQIDDQPAIFALEGSIAIAGALVQWLRDNLHFFKDASEIESLAGQVEDSGGAYIVPAFSGLYAPYWKSDARGVIAGLTRYVTRAHLARAALEAVCYQTCDVLRAMRNDADVDLKELKVDGGMVVNELLMQFQADILDVQVVRPRINETTSLGAALAAGIAIGMFASLDDVRHHWQADRSWAPAMDVSIRNELLAGWNKAVERSFGWIDP